MTDVTKSKGILGKNQDLKTTDDFLRRKRIYKTKNQYRTISIPIFSISKEDKI